MTKISPEYSAVLGVVSKHQKSQVNSEIVMALPLEVIEIIRNESDCILMDYSVESLPKSKYAKEIDAMILQFDRVKLKIIATNKHYRISREYLAEYKRQQEILMPVGFFQYGPEWMADMQNKDKDELIEMLKATYQEMARILKSR